MRRLKVGPLKGLFPQGRPGLKEILQNMQDQGKALLGDTPECILQQIRGSRCPLEGSRSKEDRHCLEKCKVALMIYLQVIFRHFQQLARMSKSEAQ